MDTNIRHGRTMIAIAVCSLLVIASFPGGTVTASRPKTADDFLHTFRQYEGSNALTTYSEFEVMRGQAVTAVQTGAFTDADRKRMRALVDVLEDFTAAYGAASDGNRVESLRLANETSRSIDQLESVDGEGYATLARLGLERFYRHQGEALYEQSRTATNTSTKLRDMQAAATAFQAGGASDRYSTVSAQESRVRATYESDQDRMRSALSTAGAFVDRCGSACGSPQAAIGGLGPAVFSTYVGARSANSQAEVAKRLAEKHGLSSATEHATSVSAATSNALFSLSIAAAVLAVLYALIVGIFAGAIAWRLASWADDVDRSKVGRIVPRDTLEVPDQ